MSEIYWITTLGNISFIMTILAAISGIATTIVLIANIIYYVEGDIKEREERMIKLLKTCRKYTIIPFIVSLLGAIFIPTTKQLYIIYGVGGTIDYLKENPTAKQLPDKVIKCLDNWVDDITPDNNEGKRDNN